MPTAHASGNEGVELALRRGNEHATQMLVQTPGDEDFARDSRRRSSLADMRQDLEDLEQQPRWRWRAKVALVFYTLARIILNLQFTEREVWEPVEYGYRKTPEYHVDFHKVCDAICRPLVTGCGLYMFVHRLDRFSWSNQLQLLSFITMCCLSLPLSDESVEHLLIYFFREKWPSNVSMLCWEVLCNVLQVYMTILKLRALRWHRTAHWCGVLTTLGICSLAVFLLNNLYCWLVVMDPRAIANLCIRTWCCCCFTVLAIQCWALCRAASRAMEQARGNDPMWWTACLLYANACLVPLGPALSFVGMFAFLPGEFLPLTLLTLDVSFQVFNVLLLSGMVGTVPMNLEALQKLAESSGFGLASARVAFPGHISQSAADCVVSFPGKYSDLWDRAV
ncbi:unnamed protein product [Symbiodinium sp. CCMP2456]|nr:unnamed protein product [Symbiodinium sp. CCMP2456]